MFLLFLKEQASKPCPDCRSRDEDSEKKKREHCTIKSDRLGVKTRSRLSFFSDTRYMPRKTPLLPLRITRRKKGNLKVPSFPPFFSNDSTYTSISFFPPGALDIIESCKRTDGWPPNFPMHFARNGQNPRTNGWAPHKN